MRAKGARAAEGKQGAGIALAGDGSKLIVEGLHMPEDQATIALWVKPATDGERLIPAEQRLGMGIRLRSRGTIWAGFYRDVIARTDRLVKLGQWTHIAVRYGDAVEVFINGQLVEKVFASKADYRSDCHKRTMHFFGDELDRWSLHGVVDDLRVYNRLLTADAIAALAEQ